MAGPAVGKVTGCPDCLLLSSSGPSAGQKPPVERMGILGGSVTFLLEGPRPFDHISWSQNGAQVANLSLGPPCHVQLSRELASREVAVSQDCRSFSIQKVRKGDAGIYTAQIRNATGNTASETCWRKVYQRLSEADLEVVCANEILSDGSRILHLNCSVVKWGDGVEFRWTSRLKTRVFFSSEKSHLLHYKPKDVNRKFTGMAKNRVGRVSKTELRWKPHHTSEDSLRGETFPMLGVWKELQREWRHPTSEDSRKGETAAVI